MVGLSVYLANAGVTAVLFAATILVTGQLPLSARADPTPDPTPEPTPHPSVNCAEEAGPCQTFLLTCNDLLAQCPPSSGCYSNYLITCDGNMNECQYVLDVCYGGSFAPTAEPTPVPTNIPTPVPTAEPTPTPTSVPTPEPTRIPPHICAELWDSCQSFVTTCNELRAQCPITSDCYSTYVSTCEQNIADCEYIFSLCNNATFAPTAEPTVEPSRIPTSVPTTEPTATPTAIPTAVPTFICETQVFTPLPESNNTWCSSFRDSCMSVVANATLSGCGNTCEFACDVTSTTTAVRRACTKVYYDRCVGTI